ncbi:bola-like protein [Pisolithus microcarpus]|nr:bola-like protein [Pisolithus microcarpus]
MLSLTRRVVVSRQRWSHALSTSTTDMEKAIVSKLTERFSPTELAVQDVSGGCGAFFAIKIASETFRDMPTVKQHKLVTEVLKKEIGGIHGLQIKTLPPAS